jgi:LysR family nitrogen assimilation transcriptional regulator
MSKPPFSGYLNLKQLQWFIRIAEAGSIEKAAAAHAADAASIAEQLYALERSLNVDLFMERGGLQLPTEAGTRLYEHAVDLLSRTRTACDQVQRVARNPAEMAILGIPPTLTSSLIPAVSREFRRLLPTAKLRIVEGMSGYIREWLATGRIDVGILYESPNVTGEILTREVLYLVGDRSLLPEGDDFPFTKLGSLPLILPSQPHGLRTLINRYAEQYGLKLNTVVESNSMDLMLDLAARKQGLTILPISVLNAPNPAYASLRGMRLASPAIYRGVVLATSTNKPVSPAIRTLLQVVRSEIRRNSAPACPAATEQLAAVPEGINPVQMDPAR